MRLDLDKTYNTFQRIIENPFETHLSKLNPQELRTNTTTTTTTFKTNRERERDKRVEDQKNIGETPCST